MLINQSIQLLLIEDDEEDIFLIRSILKKPQTNSIDVVNSVSECNSLDLTKYDIILLDLNLGETHGLHTLIELRKIVFDIPIIILTGLSDEVTALEALRLGAQDYIYKDEINFSQIKKSVVYSIERNKLMQALKSREEQIRQLNKDLEAKNKKLAELAIKDPLTGIYNLRFFEESILIKFSHAHRHNHELVLFTLDLDNFKEINDTWGHDVGDRVLKEFAVILKENTRKSDVCGRLGGDEFAFFGRMELDQIEAVAEKVLTQLRSISYGEFDQYISISMGIASLHPKIETVDQLRKNADLALYQAKKKGKNTFVVFKQKGKEQ
jgi:diguanylate cyclase (GGDEF)-like protein